MPRLEDVIVNSVHLVGDPANKRPFALLKNIGGAAQTDPPPDPENTIVKDKLKALLEKAGDADVDVAAVVEAVGKDALTKALGGGGDPEPQPATLPEEVVKSLPPEVKAKLDALEKENATIKGAVDSLVKQREDEQRAAVQKRAQALKDAGFDVDVEKATEVEVAAMEKAAKNVQSTLEALGVFKAAGSAGRDDEPGASIRDEVRKEVTRRLGREPMNKAEELTVRNQIYKDLPGLLAAVLDEEKSERAHA